MKRSQVIQAIAHLVAVKGTLLVLTCLRDRGIEPDGLPWPLSEAELVSMLWAGQPPQRSR